MHASSRKNMAVSHAYVRGNTRHDEHGYVHGMSHGTQPRPFCSVDRQRPPRAAVLRG